MTDVLWGIDANGYWEGHFQVAEKKLRADFAKDGHWVETEDSIHFNDLPEAVQAAIEKDFVKKDIVELERVDNAERGAFYDVEFKSKGTEKVDVEFRDDGVVLAQKRR